ncbi:MAG TPA: peptidylprolyl isomerase [Woeseiaceae bacterium]|jgi:peptidyl-prolyl cis-trans isomerase SurA
MSKIKYLAILLLGLSGLLRAAELSETGRMLDGIAAVVNEGVVLKSQLYRDTATIVARAQAQGMQLPPDDILQQQVLERLIVEEAQLQRAERIGLQVSDQMLNEAILRVAQQNGIQFERLPELLAADGINYADYRRDTRKQITLEQLRRIEVIGRISVAPREIQQCIDDLEDNVVVNSEYDLAHILVSIPESATGEQIDAADAEVQDVYRQLLLGADFSEMAIRHSDSQTGLEGGQLGWLKGDQLPTMFYNVVGDLEPGEISQPVRTVSGFHVVKVNDMRSAVQRSQVEQLRLRHILITPNEIIDDQTAKQRLDDARKQLQEGAEFGELAKLMSDDPGSANDGGEMGWSAPGTFVPEFEQVANSSEPGVVSEPFRSRFGWHILEVLERRTYDNTEDLKRENCDMQIRNSKLASETELWLRRIRDEAYVETRI